MSTGATESVATSFAVWLGLVLGAIRACPAACLLGIALANTWATNGTRRGEFTVATAVFVGVIADCISPELAGVGVAALVVATSRLPTTVALFVAFDDAIATCLAGNGSNASVVGETA